jgi:hypothetical protein
MNFNETTKPKRSLGTLRKSTKTKPRSSDLTGQLRLQRHTAAAIVKQFSEEQEEVVCNLAGWKNRDYGGAYLTAEISPRFVPRATSDAGDIIESIINDPEEENIDVI